MTREDLELIAAAVKTARGVNAPDGQYEQGWWDACDEAARDLASALQFTNPRFDRDRFLAACGVTQPA